ncbi:MAG: hypothetical protein J0M34_04225 [Alphaproteobacteria bacterium]|nr:hypothetical protein [Alphaproteobacteria bacterium]
MRFLAMAFLVTLLAGCEEAHNSSDTAARVANQVKEDTVGAWREVFTFRPTKPKQAPQTRYCYQMQSDISCYDTPQTHMTSKLVGYQDGESISYIQKGGGSMGISTAQTQITPPNAPPSSMNAAPYSGVSSDDLMAYPTNQQEIRVDETNAPPPALNPTTCTPGMSPFECNESQYIPNAEVGR